MVLEVQAGAAFLDETVGPQWIEQVNLDRLDIESGCGCVAAQVVGGFEGGFQNAWEYAMHEWGVVKLDGLDPSITGIDMDRARELGFLGYNASEGGAGAPWVALEDGWRELIAERTTARAPA